MPDPSGNDRTEGLSGEPAEPPRPTGIIGHTLAQYKVLEKIGEGGMGSVYRADDTRLGRTVAVKTIRAAAAHDPELAARFRTEARAVAALNHPNVVTIYSVEESQGRTFIIMETTNLVPLLQIEALVERAIRAI